MLACLKNREGYEGYNPKVEYNPETGRWTLRDLEKDTNNEEEITYTYSLEDTKHDAEQHYKVLDMWVFESRTASQLYEEQGIYPFAKSLLLLLP